MNTENQLQTAQRLQALKSYGVLDTPPEAVFDDLTRLAAQICQTPYALISLIDKDRLWFKSRAGLAVREIPATHSFCREAIEETEVLVVCDAREDARFTESAMLTELPHLRFYAGAALFAPEGTAVGTLCVLDDKPRSLSIEQRDALAILAKQVMAQLELRRALHSARTGGATVREVERTLQEDAAVLETLARVGADLTAELDLERLLQKITDAAKELTGARFGALFYNSKSSAGEIYQLYTLSGAPREAFERFPAPRKTAVFGPTFRGEGVVRSADILKDPRYGKNAPHHGLPDGHLPVRSYLAVPLVSRAGDVIGGLLFGHPEPGIFTDRAERLATGIAAQAAIAIDNARLYQRAMDDIAAREQAEEALRETTARLQFTLESAAVGDWDLDLTSDTARRSLRHDQCFGYNEPIQDWGFESFIQHVHPEDRQWVEQAFRTAVEQLKDWRFECRVIWPDQSVHWIAAHGSIYYVDGKPSRMLGIIFDATEQKRVEEALKSANARLTESDRRKDEFLAMLAHELRNPLGAIRNTVRLLERAPAESQPQRYLEILERQSRTLSGLVDDLLEVSRVTRGLVELKHERVDLSAVIERALESAQPLVDEKRHEVSVTLPRKRMEVSGDALRLEQILVNLLINAAKYTDPGGRIALSLETHDEKVEIRVRDTGIGMTPEVIERIFDLFGQAERGLDRAQGGLGIGLTIVKSLVELHGGRIAVTSEGPGRGAEFLVVLPLTPAEEGERAPTVEKPIAAAGGANKRVLLVDDSADAAETLALLLGMFGHDVAVAHDGLNALTKAEEIQPEVILLDIGLPGIDGYEVARRLRQNPHTRGAVLAALTGYGQPDDVEQAMAAGFDKHFVKPVDIDALEAFLNNATLAVG